LLGLVAILLLFTAALRPLFRCVRLRAFLEFFDGAVRLLERLVLEQLLAPRMLLLATKPPAAFASWRWVLESLC
jgi:hypothetical protein